jgi:hypothetical protein
VGDSAIGLRSTTENIVALNKTRHAIAIRRMRMRGFCEVHMARRRSSPVEKSTETKVSVTVAQA